MSKKLTMLELSQAHQKITTDIYACVKNNNYSGALDNCKLMIDTTKLYMHKIKEKQND